MVKQLACALLFAVSSGLAYAGEVEQITDDNVPFIYESRAELQTSDATLAEFLSVDYRRARDEFTKYDLMQKIQPVLEKRLALAKATNEFVVRISSELGQYDFAGQKFPTGFNSGTYIPYNNGYALTFDNSTDIEFLPMEIEQAKILSKQLQRDRRITATVYVTITGTKEQQLSYRHSKSLKAKITGVEYQFKKGDKISSITL